MGAIVILTVTNMKLGSRLQNFTCVIVSIFWCFNVKMKLNGLISVREPESTSYQEMKNVLRVRRCILPHWLDYSIRLPRNSFCL